MNLTEIGQTQNAINEAKGWSVFSTSDWPKQHHETTRIHALCTHMALVHTEVSEATEAIRKFDQTNFTEELADVVLRVSSIAWGLGLDLDAAVKAKIEKNRQRELHHGGKAV